MTLDQLIFNYELAKANAALRAPWKSERPISISSATTESASEPFVQRPPLSGPGWTGTGSRQKDSTSMGQDLAMPSSKGETTGAWENEGGSVKQTSLQALPEGIVAITLTQYRVGPYTYTNLDDALAEHKRQSKSSR